jgi:hypothetical protein
VTFILSCFSAKHWAHEPAFTTIKAVKCGVGTSTRATSHRLEWLEGGHLAGRRDSPINPRWPGWIGCHRRRGRSIAQHRWLRPPLSLRRRRGWPMHHQLWRLPLSPTFYTPSLTPPRPPRTSRRPVDPSRRPKASVKEHIIPPPIARASGDLVHVGPDLLMWGGPTLTWMASKGNPYIILDDAEEMQMWSEF